MGCAQALSPGHQLLCSRSLFFSFVDLFPVPAMVSGTFWWPSQGLMVLSSTGKAGTWHESDRGRLTWLRSEEGLAVALWQSETSFGFATMDDFSTYPALTLFSGTAGSSHTGIWLAQAAGFCKSENRRPKKLRSPCSVGLAVLPSAVTPRTCLGQSAQEDWQSRVALDAPTEAIPEQPTANQLQTHEGGQAARVGLNPLVPQNYELANISSCMSLQFCGHLLHSIIKAIDN